MLQYMNYIAVDVCSFYHRHHNHWSTFDPRITGNFRPSKRFRQHSGMTSSTGNGHGPMSASVRMVQNMEDWNTVDLIHIIHGTGIFTYIHLVDFYGKCRELYHPSGQIQIFHQARFPWNQGMSLLSYLVRWGRYMVAIIWVDGTNPLIWRIYHHL